MSELTDMREKRVAEQGEIIARLRMALVKIRDITESDRCMSDREHIKDWVREAVDMALDGTDHD